MSIELQFDEKELVSRLINGDQEAFAVLYAHYKNRLVYFGMQFLKSRDHVEDIFQDTFFMVWENRKYINSEYPFSSYIYTCFRNRVWNELRALCNDEKYRQYVLANAVTGRNEVEEQINFRQLDELLNKALEHLTVRQKQIFLLRRNQHLSNKEIAEKLHLSVYTVQEHISDSLKIIRSYIGSESDIVLDLMFVLLLVPLT